MPFAPPRHRARQIAENRKSQNKVYNREYNLTKRTGQDFYNSSSWRRLRKWFINSNPLCKKCLGDGKIIPADVVDHIIPIKNGGDLMAADNLQSLCHLHHNQKTAAVARGRGGSNV